MYDGVDGCQRVRCRVSCWIKCGRELGFPKGAELWMSLLQVDKKDRGT
jgi:hypothetical protein